MTLNGGFSIIKNVEKQGDFVKIFLNELLSLQGEPLLVDQELVTDFVDFEHPTLKELSSCWAQGTILYDALYQRASVQLHLVGSMILPHSVTNELVSIPFDTELFDVFSFVDGDLDEDVVEVKEDFIDLNPFVFAAIVAEIPLRIVTDEPYQYPKGQGWKVMSEQDYDQKEKPMDPRLAKLKEFKFE